MSFKTIPLKRGVYEIMPIYKVTKEIGAMICGGWVRYMASTNKKPVVASDVDIYSTNDEMFDELKDAFNGLTIKHENEISITFETAKEGPFAFTPIIQLIKPIEDGHIVAKGSMEKILDNFDFTVVRAAMISETEALVDEDFEDDEAHKLLRLRNIHCPISSTLRCMKYAKKGYWLRPREALKLFLDWSSRSDQYRFRMIELFELSDAGDLSEEQVNELERLLRID